MRRPMPIPYSVWALKRLAGMERESSKSKTRNPKQINVGAANNHQPDCASHRIIHIPTLVWLSLFRIRFRVRISNFLFPCLPIASTPTPSTESASVCASRTTGTSWKRNRSSDWFEIISENYMVDAGRPLMVLDQILEQYRVVQHGVSMYFGNAARPNRDHLRKLKRLVKTHRHRALVERPSLLGQRRWTFHPRPSAACPTLGEAVEWTARTSGSARHGRRPRRG